MDQNLIESIISEIQRKNPSVDIWSKEFLFDERFAEIRSKPVVFGGNGKGKSLVSFLLRDGMTSERRTRIFDSQYDLGTGKPITVDFCHIEKLTDELYGDEEESVDSNNLYKSIIRDISSITRKQMRSHYKTNRSTALKVIKTLYLVRKREKHLMRLLILPKPGKKFSMSLRSSYPYKKNQDQVWLLADLLAYMSVELDKDLIVKIENTFSTLLEQLTALCQKIEEDLYGSIINYQEMIIIYQELIALAKSFSIEHGPKNIPLDEEFFIHLHRLEFAHFAIGFPQLVSEVIPKWVMTNISGELTALTKKMFPESGSSAAGFAIFIQDVPAFAIEWQDELVEIMRKGMGADISDIEYKKIITNSEHLLTNYFLFQDGQFGKVASKSVMVDFNYVIAALCCAWYSTKSPTTIKPYWMGQQSQGGSVNTTINIAPLENLGVIDEVPEEHRHFWRHRLAYFEGALRGTSTLEVLRMGFKSVLVTRVLEIVRSNDIDSIQLELKNFINCIANHF